MYKRPQSSRIKQSRDYHLKYCLNKCVLRLVLKHVAEGEFLTSKGSLFHSTAAAYLNDLSPYVLSLVVGTFKSSNFSDRRGRGHFFFITRLHRYSGAREFTHL